MEYSLEYRVDLLRSRRKFNLSRFIPQDQTLIFLNPFEIANKNWSNAVAC